MNNVPTMMYTPNKDNYIQEMRIRPGMNFEIPFDKIKFEMQHLKSYELYQAYHNYYPLVISINYQKNGKMFAFINYGHFQKDSTGKIKGAQISKQVVLVSMDPTDLFL